MNITNSIIQGMYFLYVAILVNRLLSNINFTRH